MTIIFEIFALVIAAETIMALATYIGDRLYAIAETRAKKKAVERLSDDISDVIETIGETTEKLADGFVDTMKSYSDICGEVAKEVTPAIIEIAKKMTENKEETKIDDIKFDF